MAQTIKIKRSTNNQSPSSLAAGELAYSFKSGVDKLYIGSGDGSEVHAIGGKSYMDKLDLIEASADVTDTTNVVAALTAGTNVAIAANGTISATNTTYSVGDGGLTQNNFTNADHSKLNGIEALADVTDAANVTAAGALMTSTITNTSAVKAINQQLKTSSSPTFATLTATSGLQIKNAGSDTDTGVGYADTSFFNSEGTLKITSHTNLGIGGDVSTTMLQANTNGVGILTAPSSTYKLDVNGAARVDSLTTSGAIDAGSSTFDELKVEGTSPRIVFADTTEAAPSVAAGEDIELVNHNGTIKFQQHNPDYPEANDGEELLFHASESSVKAYNQFIAPSANITGELDAVTLDVSGNADIDGTVTLGSAAVAAVIGGGTEENPDTPAVPAKNTTVKADLIVDGDLTVSGTTTTINTETIELADNIIELNSNVTGNAAIGTAGLNAGITVNRGSGTTTTGANIYNSELRWSETSGEWTVTEAFYTPKAILHTGNVEDKDFTIDGGSFDTA